MGSVRMLQCGRNKRAYAINTWPQVCEVRSPVSPTPSCEVYGKGRKFVIASTSRITKQECVRLYLDSL